MNTNFIFKIFKLNSKTLYNFFWPVFIFCPIKNVVFGMLWVVNRIKQTDLSVWWCFNCKSRSCVTDLRWDSAPGTLWRQNHHGHQRRTFTLRQNTTQQGDAEWMTRYKHQHWSDELVCINYHLVTGNECTERQYSAEEDGVLPSVRHRVVAPERSEFTFYVLSI